MICSKAKYILFCLLLFLCSSGLLNAQHEVKEKFERASGTKKELPEVERWLRRYRQRAQKQEIIRDQAEMRRCFEEGRTLYEKGRYQEALERFKRALDLDSRNKGAIFFLKRTKNRIASQEHLARAEEYFLNGEYDTARVAFLRSLGLNPDNQRAKESLARLERVIETERRTRDEKINACYQLARRLYRKGEYSAALQEFKKVLALDSMHSGALFYLPKTEDLLVREIRKTTELEAERRITTRYKEGKSLYKAGKTLKAISKLEKVIDLDPTHQGAQRYLRKAREQVKCQERQLARGEKKREEGVKEREERIKESYIYSLYGRSEELYREGKFEEAEYQFRKVLVVSPGHEGAKKYLAKIENARDRENELATRKAANSCEVAEQPRVKEQQAEQIKAGQKRRVEEKEAKLKQRQLARRAREEEKETLRVARAEELEKRIKIEAEKSKAKDLAREEQARIKAEKERARELNRKQETQEKLVRKVRKETQEKKEAEKKAGFKTHKNEVAQEREKRLKELKLRQRELARRAKKKQDEERQAARQKKASVSAEQKEVKELVRQKQLKEKAQLQVQKEREKKRQKRLEEQKKEEEKAKKRREKEEKARIKEAEKKRERNK